MSSTQSPMSATMSPAATPVLSPVQEEVVQVSKSEQRRLNKLENLRKVYEDEELKFKEAEAALKAQKKAKKEVEKKMKRLQPKDTKKTYVGTINTDVCVSDALSAFLECPRVFKRPKIMTYIKAVVDKHDLKGEHATIRLQELPGFLELLTPEERAIYEEDPASYSLSWRNIQRKLSHHIASHKAEPQVQPEAEPTPSPEEKPKVVKAVKPKVVKSKAKKATKAKA